jgi:hypothetical protein
VTLNPSEPLLTLEPVIDAVREGVESAGWQLSGLQKTTSHQFEGRWAGDSTRSAYLFFHDPVGPDWASVDVYLDETLRGLAGNLALVLDCRTLEGLGDVPDVLATLARMARAHLPEGHHTPITLRLRLDEPDVDVGSASSEVRFKLRIPKVALQAGAAVVTALASGTVQHFAGLLRAPELQRLLDTD